jgi:pimeloyl-ACP methyl ester carboxylesterase
MTSSPNSRSLRFLTTRNSLTRIFFSISSSFGNRLRAFGLAALYTFIPATSFAQLQYDRTSFIPGFSSDSSIWTQSYVDLGATPPNYLAASVVIKIPEYPNLNTSARYPDQIASLGSFVNSVGGQQVLVGHSLGSLVSRGTYIEDASARSRIAGIIAIAGPHQGTVLADSAIKARNFFGDAQRRIVAAIPGILAEAAVVSWLVAYATDNPNAGMLLYLGTVGLVFKFGQALDLTKLYQLLQIPSLADLSPTSAAITSLNQNLTDSQIQRANVYGSIPIQNAALRVFYSSINKDADFPGGVVLYNKAIAVFKSCKYFNYATIIGWNSGRNCAYAVKVLRRIDDRWTRYVNGTDANGRPRLVPFDGVVSNERSHYPTTAPISFDRLVPGVDHLNIYKTKLGLNQVTAGMLAIGMQPINPDPPPNPVTAVRVSGPTRVNGCQGATWTATATGGTAPISYTWTVENETIDTGTSSGLAYTNTGTQYSIFVRVTAKDANNTSVTSSSFKTNVTLPGSC